MDVVDHEFGGWFLLREGGDYFLDVLCDRSLVNFSVTVRLTEEERRLYAGDGRTAIEALAGQIAGRSDPLDPRQIEDQALLDRINGAIRTWNRTH